MPSSRDVRILSVGVALLVGMTLARGDDAEKQAQKWVTKIRQAVRQDAELSEVQIKSGHLKRRKFLPGLELVLVCEGAAEEQLRNVQQLAIEILSEDKEGAKWLEDNTISATNKAVAGDTVKADVAADERKMLARLIRNAQDQLEQRNSLRGALIHGVRIGTAPDRKIELQLTGNVLDDEQKPTVEAVVIEQVAADSAWKNERDHISISARLMKTRTPNNNAAGRFFATGQQHFSKQEYTAAEESFSQAIADAPDNEIYPLWNIVTAAAKGEDDRAKRGLRTLLLRDPRGFSSREVSPHFEKVQGTLRNKLAKLEREVLASMKSE